jgi:hypothetical protein
MGKGFPRAHDRGKFATSAIPSKVVVAAALAFAVDGAAGVGFGTAVLGALPQGNIMFLGAVAYMQFSGPGGEAGLVDTWAGDYAIGTTPMSDATISGDDANVVPSTALAAATAEVSPRTRGTEADGSLSGVIFDNTAGDLELNINLLVDDANISADDIAFTVDGEVHLTYVLLGDD